jgi:hypothetical protein
VERQALDNSGFGNNTIVVADAISAPKIPPSAPRSRTPSVTASGGLSTGVAVGIAVGAVALVGLIVAIAVIVRSRKARDMREISALSASLTPDGEKDLPKGPLVCEVQPPYPPPFQPTGACAPFPPSPDTRCRTRVKECPLMHRRLMGVRVDDWVGSKSQRLISIFVCQGNAV